MGISVDEVLNIWQGEDVIRVCGVTKMENLTDLYLEYIKFHNGFVGKHFFRSVLIALAKHFYIDTFVLESNEENKPIYEYLGATETGYDDFREMWEYRLPIELL